VSVQIGAWLAKYILQPLKSVWVHPMVLLGDGAQDKARFGPFADSANSDTR
jgi:hypothetical protein